MHRGQRCPRLKTRTVGVPFCRSFSVKGLPSAKVVVNSGIFFSTWTGPLYSGSRLIDKMKYHSNALNRTKTAKAMSRIQVGRWRTETSADRAPTVNKIGMYQGVARCLNRN